jgi:hypothetical protein
LAPRTVCLAPTRTISSPVRSVRCHGEQAETSDKIRWTSTQDKVAICRDLELEPQQFDRALHRARTRLREIVETLGLRQR